MDKPFIKSEISFAQTLKESNLTEIGLNAGEIVIDSIIDDGLLKEIPIISTIVGLVKTTSDLGNMQFLKKIVYFLSGIKDVSPKRRYEMIAEIDNSPKYKIKVGEKLLYIINRCDDHEKASLVAELFKAFLNKEIEYGDFLRGSSILHSIYVDDLEAFLELNENNLYAEDVLPFVSLGLCSIVFAIPKLNHHEQIDWDDGPEYYSIDEGESLGVITDIGGKLRKIFNKYKEYEQKH